MIAGCRNAARLRSADPFILARRDSPNAKIAIKLHPSILQTRFLKTKRSQRLRPSSPARTRFAPSPTGQLHLGSLRTALFNYLLAKSTGGQCILRIEDTDQKRTVAGAEENLQEELAWAGIQFDEGPGIESDTGPYRQSQRTAIYREHVGTLLDSGHAYRCFCSKERLEQLSSLRQKQGFSSAYDRRCAGISPTESDERAAQGESHTIRLKVQDVIPTFDDIVYGKVGPEQTIGRPCPGAYGDPVLLKSDGLPTYHLANVVDDRLMGITHVVRGSEWLTSTPWHMALYSAFGWQPPEFAHVALLVGTNHAKLSKRTDDIGIASYRNRGIFPEALTNYVALMGWSHDGRSDCMNMQELIEKFSLRFTKGNTIVTDDKLWFLQKAHAARAIESGGPRMDQMVEGLVQAIKREIDDEGLKCILSGRSIVEYAKEVLHIDRHSFTTPTAFVEDHPYYFRQSANKTEISVTEAGDHPLSHDEVLSLARRFCEDRGRTSDLDAMSRGPSSWSDWSSSGIQSTITEMIQAAYESSPHRLSGGAFGSSKKEFNKQCYALLHEALTEGLASPSISKVMAVLGKEESMLRIRALVCERVQSALKSDQGDSAVYIHPFLVLLYIST